LLAFYFYNARRNNVSETKCFFLYGLCAVTQVSKSSSERLKKKRKKKSSVTKSSLK